MAEAIIAGLLRHKLVGPEQIIGSHPRDARHEELSAKYGIRMTACNREAVLVGRSVEKGTEAVDRPSMVILAVKPQRVMKVLNESKGSNGSETTGGFNRCGRAKRNDCQGIKSSGRRAGDAQHAGTDWRWRHRVDSDCRS